jgi:sugar lactone lactonase YvrE
VTLALGVTFAPGCKKKDDKKNSAPTPIPEPSEPPPAPMPAPTSWKLAGVGLETPESVLYDAEADRYLVSNINGSPFEADGNGFISAITPDRVEVANLKWIDGAKEGVTLNAPKGMALLGDLLYVSDIDTVRMFDRKTGEPKGEVVIKGASFLNDLVVGNGAVYVSDTGVKEGFAPAGTDAIYKIEGGKATRVIKGDELGHPNGLAMDGDTLFVVTFGSGEIYSVGADGKRGEAQKLPHGQLDGIVSLGDGEFLVSSWEGKEVFRGKVGGEWAQVVADVEGPADIGFDTKRKRILIPLFNASEVRVEALP